MTDYRLSNLSKLVKRVNTLANKKLSLSEDLRLVEEEANTLIKDISEILRYHGIKGSYERLQHFTKDINGEKVE